MALELYSQKRKFSKTPEPTGHTLQTNASLFVIQKHSASRLHYDLRLESAGVLKSWAVPKGPSMDPKQKRLAMLVEDHPIDYRFFEGVIPAGNYGAGEVIIWDRGHYVLKEGESVYKAFEKGHVKFEVFGEKVKGIFNLIRSGRDEKSWFLIKDKDAYSDEFDVTKLDRSVISNLRIKEISTSMLEPDIFKKLKTLPKKEPAFYKPMLATLFGKPFNDPGWVYEIKWDGYRIVAVVNNGDVKLYSRNENDYTEKFSAIALELKGLGRSVVIDGEVVSPGPRGSASFQNLQNFSKGTPLVYWAFDLLNLDGRDLTSLPLVNRKELLREMIFNFEKIKYSDHFYGMGEELFDRAKTEKLEGIIAKNSTSQYISGIRSRDWFKIKAINSLEAVICGFTEPRGGRKLFGSLVLGLYEGKNLVYVGHSGSGFTEKTLEETYKLLSGLRVEKPLFAQVPKTNMPVTWVKPVLVCEVNYTEFTKEKSLRHPIFKRLRPDKGAKEANFSQLEKSDQVENFKEDNKVNIKVSNPGKIFWPKEKITKGQLVEYYAKISSYILPYLRDRPQSLNRFPNGINQKNFYQKDITQKVPQYLETIKIFSSSEKTETNYLLLQNKKSLLYAANLGCIEINPWGSRVGFLDNPDYLVIDLDPVEIGFEAVIESALVVFETLEKIGVVSYPKTSGATGIHIYIPLNAKYTYEQVQDFAKIIVIIVNKKIPKITSIVRDPAKRKNKVYLDYLQNRKGQTIAAPYCLRPLPGAPVSTPLNWDEVGNKLDPLKFNITSIFKRLEKVGDIFKPVLGKGIDLNVALEKLQGNI